jgi:hypothetical protein
MKILTLIEGIIKQIRDLVVELTAEEEITADVIEARVWKLVLEIGRLLIEGIIRIRGTGYTDKEIKTPSGELAEYLGDKDIGVWTLMGKVTIRRAYYYLGKGKGGYVPLDESLAIPQEHYSYAVQEAMSLFAIEDSFGESEKKLKRLFPISLSDSTIRRITQKHGEWITSGEESKVKAIFSHKQPVPEPEIKSVARGYPGIDGVLVPTVNGYKEMKVGVTYDTPKTKDALANNLHYMAMFAKPEQFGEHFWVMLKERGMYDADETFWICDGAKWEWKLKAYHDPEGGEIVDFIHAREYLTKVANAICSPEESSKCAICMAVNLRYGGGTQVLKALGKLSKVYTCEDLTKAITYFRNNHKRMDYPKYEALGYHITSSPVESACRHVVGDRLKRSGMRWTEEGAQFVTSLRLKWKNSEWDDYWKTFRPSMAV